MDTDALAREILVALRGDRSQIAWSRRLGYRSNVAYTWEHGRRWPTAAESLRAAGRAGVDLRGAILAFYGASPPWLTEHPNPAEPAAVAAFLSDLRGSVSITDLARRSGRSRFVVTRWLAGQTQPRLPDFLHMIEVCSLRLIDFIACLVDVQRLPTAAPVWARVEARRSGAAALPWTQAVLRALELEDYRALPAHVVGWVAARLGISEASETDCVRFLLDTQQVRIEGEKLVVDALAVDTRRSPAVSRRLKAHWSEVATARILADAGGQFSYNVFSVSRDDLERIRQLHLAYYQELRAIVASSPVAERVVVTNLQLFALDRMEDAAPSR